MPLPTVEEDALRHLTHGWLGFVQIMDRWTDRGFRFPVHDLHRLRRAQVTLCGLLEKQLKARADMVTTGPRLPTSLTSDLPGTNHWTDVGVAESHDRSWANVHLTGGEITDLSVQLVVNGTPVGDNLSQSAVVPYLENDDTVVWQEYGGPSSTWGVSLSPIVMNAEGFGISYRVQDSTMDESATLVMTGLGLGLASTAIVVGVKVELARANVGDARVKVYGARLTVYYIE